MQCADGTEVSGAKVYAGENGLEVCNDAEGSDAPQGRIIVSVEGGYVAIDGDKDNDGELQGYVRLDADGPHCSSGDRQDSTEPDQSDNDCF